MDLTAQEQAYFSSRGEEAPPEEVASTEAPAEQGQEEAVAEAAEPQEQPAETEQPGEGEERSDKPRMVPHGALHEERQRRKDAEERARKYEERFAAWMEKFGPQSQQPEQPDQAQIPDVDVDPVGHFKAKSELLERQLAEVNDWRQNVDQRTQAQEQFRQLATHVSQSEAAFAAEHPDYQQALGYLVDAQKRAYETMGFNEQEIAQALAADKLNLAQTAMQRGQNPAEIVYKLATARGYSAQQKQAAERPRDETGKFQAIQKGAQGPGRSLGTASGGPAPSVSLETMANMSDDEFAALMASKDGKATFRRLMGG